MHYLLLIHVDESGSTELKPEQVQIVMQEMDKFDRELSENGQNLGSIRLQPSTVSTVVRVRGGEVLTTDGPFVEAKEQVGGIYMIEAADQEEANSIAGRLPTTSFGSVEVRPVLGIDLRRAIRWAYEE